MWFGSIQWGLGQPNGIWVHSWGMAEPNGVWVNSVGFGSTQWGLGQPNGVGGSTQPLQPHRRAALRSFGFFLSNPTVPPRPFRPHYRADEGDPEPGAGHRAARHAELLLVSSHPGRGAAFVTSPSSSSSSSSSSRSEERRVGKECKCRCRSRWSPYH